MRGYSVNAAKRQKGSTLLVAIILLLLAGLMSVLAMNVGIFEQRSSGNDLRAKVVKQVAEAGLAQGFEFLMRANPTWVDDISKWDQCPSDDLEESGRKFPCGAVPLAVRGSMWHLKADVGGYAEATGKTGGLSSDLTKYMLKTEANAAVGNFDVAYGVAPLLCRVPLPVSSSSISCSVGMSNLSDRRVVTFVSVAQVRGDSGRMTLTQTVSRSSLLAQGAGVPALIATGNVTPNGNGDVVAMPNAGGPGLDISIWTRGNVDTKSAFGTCDRQTFLASAEVSLNNPDWREESLSGGCPKNPPEGEGWDVLDDESPFGQAAITHEGINNDVDPTEFPPDLFEYAFGVKTWQNTGGDPNFYETRLPKVNVTINGKDVSLYPDEVFLYTNAAQIIGDDLGLATAEQTASATLGPSSSGLIWCKSGCGGPKMPGAPDAVGSPTNPVVLVADGAVQNNGSIIYGMIFLRDPNASINPEKDGGVASYKTNGSKGAVFGSVFIQGKFETGSGNAPIVGDADIMLALSNNPKLAAFNTLRGGWTDRYSY